MRHSLYAPLLACTLVAAVGLNAGAVQAQGTNKSTIRIVVPYGSGGAPDVLGRLLAQKMTESMGQPVIVDNKPGASGIIAAEFVMKAAPDGNTLFLADTGHLAINPALNPKLPYSPLRDFTPVAQAIYSPFFLFAQTSLGVQSVKELIALAKAKPGLNYGTSGNGTPHHLCMALFANGTGTDMTHVPYKGVAQSIPALAAGDVTLMCTSPLTGMPVVRAGKARVLAVASLKRSPVMPEIPTLAESGVPDIEVGASVGLLLPAGAARDLVQKLANEIMAAINSPDATARMVALGQEVVPRGPDQYAELMRNELQNYARTVKISGAKLD
ncbi:MAG: Bug family tripartite tricarboxylate transporter substrate binding protein [Burkholderiales bacterium]